MRFSSGRYSQAICDRCGFAFPYQSIQTEPGTGWRVCRSSQAIIPKILF